MLRKRQVKTLSESINIDTQCTHCHLVLLTEQLTSNANVTGSIHVWAVIFTQHAKLSGAVYCNWSRLFVGLWLCLFLCLWVCYHDNSKLRGSILTKLGF